VDDGVRVDRSGSDAVITWNLAVGATSSDLLRGLVSELPVGPGGSDEVCLAQDAVLTTHSDAEIPGSGVALWYLVRGRNVCGGKGTYGFAARHGAPQTERVDSTCP
jgi:hypothetical protein